MQKKPVFLGFPRLETPVNRASGCGTSQTSTLPHTHTHTHWETNPHTRTHKLCCLDYGRESSASTRGQRETTAGFLPRKRRLTRSEMSVKCAKGHLAHKRLVVLYFFYTFLPSEQQLSFSGERQTCSQQVVKLSGSIQSVQPDVSVRTDAGRTAGVTGRYGQG